MADVAKSYGIGDTVWVWYHESPLNSVRYVAQSRVVASVKTTTSGNEAHVIFTNGDSVTDGATPRIFDTAALASTAIVSAAIVNTAAAVALDVTTSITSTSAQASTTLGRIG